MQSSHCAVEHYYRLFLRRQSKHESTSCSRHYIASSRTAFGIYHSVPNCDRFLSSHHALFLRFIPPSRTSLSLFRVMPRPVTATHCVVQSQHDPKHCPRYLLCRQALYCAVQRCYRFLLCRQSKYDSKSCLRLLLRHRNLFSEFVEPPRTAAAFEPSRTATATYFAGQNFSISFLCCREPPPLFTAPKFEERLQELPPLSIVPSSSFWCRREVLPPSIAPSNRKTIPKSCCPPLIPSSRTALGIYRTVQNGGFFPMSHQVLLPLFIPPARTSLPLYCYVETR